MSFKCINNSKLNSNAFKSSTFFFSKLNKDAHDAMFNMIIIFGSLQPASPVIAESRLVYQFDMIGRVMVA